MVELLICLSDKRVFVCMYVYFGSLLFVWQNILLKNLRSLSLPPSTLTYLPSLSPTSLSTLHIMWYTLFTLVNHPFSYYLVLDCLFISTDPTLYYSFSTVQTWNITEHTEGNVTHEFRSGSVVTDEINF